MTGKTFFDLKNVTHFVTLICYTVPIRRSLCGKDGETV